MSYNGDVTLRGKNQKIETTKEQVAEWMKCKEDILHFAENYFYILTIDEGKMKIPLRDYQKKILKAFIEPTNGRKNCVLSASRQCGKCNFYATKIKVRNKKTGEIMEVSIGDFYKQHKK